ncbi:hypothetical protein MINS_12170 [Mycolicibacterium insubricum]|uniref:Uncharacterized protein n=1 Tax=Mycolicibacterium insubricum TaxID=444597 RepID=A0A1X0CL34_9MYCO|nr:hypothetical protein [Mycolicibacterium insubricum]MCV7084114.1 hypothetical protein [Mycolicibacterium insubricum]ORA60785.1 hypothetical protein BST26_21425 [Mycolicibacterium insubricum]BBZ65788.1 hypothetical protein MINS_12170 [Mycolicibacterium insubricum]
MTTPLVTLTDDEREAATVFLSGRNFLANEFMVRVFGGYQITGSVAAELLDGIVAAVNRIREGDPIGTVRQHVTYEMTGVIAIRVQTDDGNRWRVIDDGGVSLVAELPGAPGDWQLLELTR